MCPPSLCSGQATDLVCTWYLVKCSCRPNAPCIGISCSCSQLQPVCHPIPALVLGARLAGLAPRVAVVALVRDLKTANN